MRKPKVAPQVLLVEEVKWAQNQTESKDVWFDEVGAAIAGKEQEDPGSSVHMVLYELVLHILMSDI
jgi:hypothetical protein